MKIQFGNYTFFGEKYWDSTQVVPIIALAYIFHAIYLLQLPGVYLLEKSGWIAWAKSIGAATNIILNFLFIPRYGIVGAAWATCISFVLMAVIFYMINRQIFPISYNWKKLGIISFSVGLIFIIHTNLLLDIPMKIIVCVSYPIIMVLTGVIRINQIRSIF